MTGPSNPRREHAGVPGTHWNTRLISSGELLDTSSESLLGDREPDTTSWDTNPPASQRPNRATRRAAARAARRTR